MFRLLTNDLNMLNTSHTFIFALNTWSIFFTLNPNVKHLYVKINFESNIALFVYTIHISEAILRGIFLEQSFLFLREYIKWSVHEREKE